MTTLNEFARLYHMTQREIQHHGQCADPVGAVATMLDHVRGTSNGYSEGNSDRAGAWTADEDNTLRRLYPTYGTRATAAALARTEKAVNKRAFKLGVSAGNHQARWRAERAAAL